MDWVNIKKFKKQTYLEQFLIINLKQVCIRHFSRNSIIFHIDLGEYVAYEIKIIC